MQIFPIYMLSQNRNIPRILIKRGSTTTLEKFSINYKGGYPDVQKSYMTFQKKNEKQINENLQKTNWNSENSLPNESNLIPVSSTVQKWQLKSEQYHFKNRKNVKEVGLT